MFDVRLSYQAEDWMPLGLSRAVGITLCLVASSAIPSAATPAPPTIDLQVSPILIVPSTVAVGGLVTISNWTVTNAGPQVSTNCRWIAYLSTDQFLDNSDRRVASGIVPSIQPQQSISQGPRTVQIPANVPGGLFFLGLSIDKAGEAGQDTNQGNNSSAQQLTIIGGTSDAEPVWRVQLRIAVGDVPSAGTDDDVYARLNSASQTLLDVDDHDDFKRNSDSTYDLDPTDIHSLRDFQELSIWKTQQNGLCVRLVELRVNGQVVFRKDLPNPCTWLDGASSSLTIAYADLRRHAAWQSYSGPAFLGSPESERVWRAQARLTVCDRASAGTDDSVSVSMKAGNHTLLDFDGFNDFRRNADFTYDLSLQDIRALSDIERLQVSKPGSDGLCLRLIELKNTV